MDIKQIQEETSPIDKQTPILTSSDSANNFLTSSQLLPEKKSFSIRKYVFIAAGYVVSIIILTIVGFAVKQQLAKNTWKDAIKRCGRNPIAIQPHLVSFSGQTNGLDISEATYYDTEAKYYCTLTEAVKDGYSREELNREASEEIKRLYP